MGNLFVAVVEELQTVLTIFVILKSFDTTKKSKKTPHIKRGHYLSPVPPTKPNNSNVWITHLKKSITRSVRNLMAPRCSDPFNKRRSCHTSLPQSGISRRDEPPVLLNLRDQL